MGERGYEITGSARARLWQWGCLLAALVQLPSAVQSTPRSNVCRVLALSCSEAGQRHVEVS